MKLRRLTPLLLLAGLTSCIIHVDAGGDPDLAVALSAWRHPGFRALADDLDTAGWDIRDIDRKQGHWRLDLRSHDGRQDADLEVVFGPGRKYRIQALEIDHRTGADARARERLRALVDPEEVEVEQIHADLDTY